MSDTAVRPSIGIILFAHGSRDPRWRQPTEAVARRVAQLEPSAVVRCAYLELVAPDLHTAAEELVALQVPALRIVPLFLGMGRHVRDDLPQLVEQLRHRHPALPIELAPAVGEDEALIELLARLALAR